MKPTAKSSKLKKIQAAWDLEKFPLEAIQQESLPYFSIPKIAIVEDNLDKIKFRLKSFPFLYRILMWTVSPVYPSDSWSEHFATSDFAKGLFVNVGSGNSSLHPEIVNTDFIPYTNVDVVTDAGHLPFKDNSVDGILCIGVLEHLQYPESAVAEMYRILKPGGKFYALIPFMVGYHASPHDYTRWTLSGTKELFRDFQTSSLKAEGGPTSALLWTLQEWLATLLSFGSVRLHQILLLFFMVTLWPIKFFDLILLRFPTASNITALFSFSGQKPKSHSKELL